MPSECLFTLYAQGICLTQYGHGEDNEQIVNVIGAHELKIFLCIQLLEVMDKAYIKYAVFPNQGIIQKVFSQMGTLDHGRHARGLEGEFLAVENFVGDNSFSRLFENILLIGAVKLIPVWDGNDKI